MKRFSEQLKKKSDTIRLRATERADLRARLESYMEYHPLPAELRTTKKAPYSTKSKVQGIVSEPFKTITLNMTFVRSAVGVFAVFVVVAVPALAERSVPGDVLYPVKTNITEEVRASLTFSPYAKIEWETKRLERRVAEARLLASEGKLTPETEAVVAQAVKEHTDAVTQSIATMRETNEDDAAIAEIAFASTLSVQADALQGYAESDSVETLNTDSSQEGHSVAVLVDTLNDVSDDAENAQQDAAPSYEALLAQVEVQTTQAYETFASIEAQASESEREDVQRRLADIEGKVSQAIELYTQETVPEPAEIEGTEPVDVTESGSDQEEFADNPTETIEITPVESADSTSTEIDVADATELLSVPDTQTEASVATPKEVESSVDTLPLSVEERQQQAVDSLREIISSLQKLIIFMTDIDVRENLTVEDLVPVTLSVEEQTKKVNNTLDSISKIQERIALQELNADIAEKVTYGLSVVNERTASAVTTRDTGAYQQAQQFADEAYAMISDIDQLVAQQKIEMEVAEDVSTQPAEEGVKGTKENIEPTEETSPDKKDSTPDVVTPSLDQMDPTVRPESNTLTEVPSSQN